MIKACVCRKMFEAMCLAWKILPGMHATRIHHWLARRGFQSPAFRWARDRYGSEFYLSPLLFLDRVILCGGVYDRTLHDALERLLKPGMTCFDVGANIGSVTMHLARLVWPDGKVYAFEPVTPIFERLTRHIERNGLTHVVSAQKLALAHMDGHATIAYADPMTENQARGSLVNRHNSDVGLTEEVEVSRLDSFVTDHKIDAVDLIKVDIQGAEPLFIEGATETLKRWAPLIFMEISPEDLRAAGATPVDIVRAMEALSYRAYEIDTPRAPRHLHAQTISEEYERPNVLFSKQDL